MEGTYFSYARILNLGIVIGLKVNVVRFITQFCQLLRILFISLNVVGINTI